MNEQPNASGAQFRADRPGERDAVRTTIVGGRPPGSGQPLGDIPRGLEVLVKKAAVDETFRDELVAHRAAAAELIGLTLSPAETAMLNAVPAAQLEAIIARTTVPEPHRRAFLGQAAAAMIAALAAMAIETPVVEGGSLGKRLGCAGGGCTPDPTAEARRKPVADQVFALFSTQFPDTKAIDRDTSIELDLHATEADLEKLRSKLQHKFGIALDADAFKKHRRVGHVIDQVTGKVNEIKRNPQLAPRSLFFPPKSPIRSDPSDSKPDEPKEASP